ncbi:MAG: Ig-like domain-containing protein [Clostridia bacterium]|nr:Ig-like domain-containing protein [Clostridia bacterium]
MLKENLNHTSHFAHHTSNKGITLIALIITIIVMLILVAVTITTAINAGLFEKAGQAVGDMQNAINYEQKLADGRIKIGDKWYASIDDYLNNNPIEQGITIEETLKLEIEEGYDVATSTPVTGRLTATLNEIEGTVTWASGKEEVAKVDQTGLVTAVAVGKAEITAKVVFEGETYEDKCTVTVEEPKITASDVYSDLPTYLGQTVNYGVTYTDASSYGNGKWELFYADGSHIYLITKGHLATGALSITGYNGTSDFTAENGLDNYPAVAAGLFNKTYDPTAAGTEADPYLKYSSSYDNMKATQYLLDSTVWATYAPESNEFADWAIGAPTFELFVKSYNAYYTDKTDVELSTPSGNGYANPLSGSNSVPTGTYLNHSSSTHYWLACPCSDANYGVRYVDGAYAGVNGISYRSRSAFRPVVCLKSNVSLSWNSETSQFDINLIEE